MRKLTICSLATVLLTLAGSVCSAEAPIVEVIVTSQANDPFQPWRKLSPQTGMGYGVLIGKNKILTTERLVRNHRLIEIRKPRSGEKTRAFVDTVDLQANLALLTVGSGWNSGALTPVEVAASLPMNAAVSICQMNETAQTQEIEARTTHVSMARISDSPHYGLAFNLVTDLSVNADGAPVLYDGKLAGLVVDYGRGMRTVLMLPYPTIRRFLADVASPPYKGFASAGFVWSPLVDPAKRRFLNIPEEGLGILILSVLPGKVMDTLKPNDVILEFAGYPIDNLGFYKDEDFGRLAFPYLVSGHHKPGDKVSVRLVRERQAQTLEITLGRWDDSLYLIPEDIEGEQPEYIVDGGLLLRELTGSYLRSRGPDWEKETSPKLTYIYNTMRGKPRKPGDRIVLLAGVLPDIINIGYQNFRDQIVTHVNGQPVSCLTDVFNILGKDGYVERVKLQSIGVDLVLDRSGMAEANKRLASSSSYRIPVMRYQKKMLSTAE